MELPQQKLMAISIQASANLAYEKRFVKISSGKLAYCGANGKAVGVLDIAADQDEWATVVTHGVILVEVGTGGVTENTEVTSDANGKAIAVSTLSATASDTDVTIPTGSTAVTSTSAQPTLTITDPTITLAGGVLPVKINGVALDTVAAGGYARILLK
jgi:hypothetical protein